MNSIELKTRPMNKAKRYKLVHFLAPSFQTKCNHKNHANFHKKWIISIPIHPSIGKVYIFWQEIFQGFQKSCYFYDRVKSMRVIWIQTRFFFIFFFTSWPCIIFLFLHLVIKITSFLYCPEWELLKYIYFVYTYLVRFLRCAMISVIW